MKSRKVRCVGPGPTPAHDDHCGPSTRPPSLHRCREEPCHYTWITGEWSQVGMKTDDGIRKPVQFQFLLSKFSTLRFAELIFYICVKTVTSAWQYETDNLWKIRSSSASSLWSHCHLQKHTRGGGILAVNHDCVRAAHASALLCAMRSR